MRRCGQSLAIFAAVTLFTIGLAASPAGALSTTRAELKGGGDLRVEGENAASNAPISIDGVVLGSADGNGEFRVETTGFTSASCVITVYDGVDTELVPLDGCTPTDTTNQLPTANAGPDMTVVDVDGGGTEPVTLNGSGSADPEGPLSSFSWTENGVSLGTTVSISPSLTVGSHSIALTVTDGDGATATDLVIVTVSAAPLPGNQTPVADAGIDQTVVDADVNGTELITLNGSASTDDGTIISYEWSEGGIPIGNAGSSGPVFLPTANLVLAGTADFMLEGNQADPDGFIPPNFGAYTDSAGDVNGDGFDDIIVVAPNWDNGTPTGGTVTDEFAEGAAFIFLGSANGIVGTSPATAHAQIETNQFGARITAGKGIGDVNNDGFADIAIGSPFYDSLYFDQPLEVNGAVFVFYGSPSGITGTDPTNADVSLFSTQLGGSFGAWLDGAGDVNGDGFDDLVVSYGYGTPFPATIPPNQRSGGAGAALVYHGGPTGITAPTGVGIDDADSVILAFEDTGLPQPTVFGTIRTVAGAGDVNGDGFDDIILGGQEANLFLGSATGIVGVDLSQARSTVAPDALGAELRVASAGDVNGDGFADVILSDPNLELEAFTAKQQGAAYVLLGGSTGLGVTSVNQAHARFFGNMHPENLGFDNDGVGDVDGDGFDDIVITALIYPGSLDWEGVGYLLRGSASGITATTVLDADTRLEARQSGVTVNGQLRGLSVSNAGDVNGDGFADIVMGKGFWTNGEPREGAAFVYLGEPFPANPNTPPIANAGPNQVYVDVDQNGSETITVDGSASIDPDGATLSYEWFEGETFLGSTAVVTATLPTTGDHTLSLVVTDAGGVSRGDVVIVRVELAPSAFEFFDLFDTLANWTTTGDVSLGTAGVFPDAPTVRIAGNASLRRSFAVAAGSTGLDISFNSRGDSFGPNDRVVVRASLDGVSFTDYFEISAVDVDGTFVFYGGSAIPLSVSWWPNTGSTVSLEFASQLTSGVAWIDDLQVRSLQAPTADNSPPIAVAGIDQTVTDIDGNGVESITLDGSASSDAGGAIASYEWRDGATSIGNSALVTRDLTVGVHDLTLIVTDDGGLTSTDAMTVTVQAAVGSPVVDTVLSVGIHTITLTVTDDQGATATDTVVITVQAPSANQPPIADAGQAQSGSDSDGNGIESFTLDGSASSDTDGSIISHSWSEGGALIGTGPNPGVALTIGSHSISLTVTDDAGATATGTVVVTVVANVGPTASAGPDQTVVDAAGTGFETVTVDGGSSVDDDGTVTSFLWSENGFVIGTTASMTTNFAVGTHTLSLQVTDNGGATAIDQIVIIVDPASPTTVPEATVTIAGPATVGRGETASWDVTVTNTGTSTINVSVEFTAPSGRRLKSISPNSSQSIADLVPGSSASLTWSGKGDKQGSGTISVEVTVAGVVMAAATHSINVVK